MTQYLKKPDVVHAWVWDGEPVTLSAIGSLISLSKWEMEINGKRIDLLIPGVDKAITVNHGDYIIVDHNRKCTVCKPYLFKERYEEDMAQYNIG